MPGVWVSKPESLNSNKMKTTTTTFIVSLSLAITGIIFLLLRKNKKDNTKLEERNYNIKEEDDSSDKKTAESIKQNQKIIDDQIIKLVKEEEFSSTAELLQTLIRELVEKNGIDILYDAPKSLSDIEECLQSLGLSIEEKRNKKKD